MKSFLLPTRKVPIAMLLLVLSSQTASSFLTEGGVAQTFGGLETSMSSLSFDVEPATVVSSQESTASSTHRRAVLLTAATTVFGRPLAVRADDAATTLHIVDYPKPGSCGQADVPPAGVFFAKNLGGMVEGSCSSDGYTVAQGTANGVKEKDKDRTYEIYGKEE